MSPSPPTAASLSGPGATGYGPYSNVSIDPASGALYVADYGNNRTLVFVNGIPTVNGASADYAIGQSGLVSYAAGTSATALHGFQSPVAYNGAFFPLKPNAGYS